MEGGPGKPEVVEGQDGRQLRTGHPSTARDDRTFACKVVTVIHEVSFVLGRRTTGPGVRPARSGQRGGGDPAHCGRGDDHRGRRRGAGGEGVTLMHERIGPILSNCPFLT